MVLVYSAIEHRQWSTGHPAVYSKQDSNCEGAQKNESEVTDALSEKIAMKVTIFTLKVKFLYFSNNFIMVLIKIIFQQKQSKAKVSVAVSDRRRTRGKAPIFQASASCGSLPLLSTPFFSS